MNCVYRIGLTTNPESLDRAIKENKPGLKYTMCLEEAPPEWHSKIFMVYPAPTWLKACEIFEAWVGAQTWRDLNSFPLAPE